MDTIKSTFIKDDALYSDDELNEIILLKKQNENLNAQLNRLSVSLIMTNIIVLFLIFSKK